MDKKLSSLKIHNIIVCAIILIIFVIFGVINTNAEEVNKKEEVLPSNRIRIGYSYRKLIEEKQKQEVNKLNRPLRSVLFLGTNNVNNFCFFLDENDILFTCNL